MFVIHVDLFDLVAYIVAAVFLLGMCIIVIAGGSGRKE